MDIQSSKITLDSVDNEVTNELQRSLLDLDYEV